MTVVTLVDTITYVGNGVSTVYTYPFYLISVDHLQVWVNGALQPFPAYTVSSVGNPFGGEVTLAVAPLFGESVTLRRAVPATQLVDYRPYDPFPAEVHEQALDKLTMIAQGLESGLANAVRAPLLEPVGATNLVLPTPAVRANFLLGFDAAGNVAMVPPAVIPGPGVTDHGALTGLADDDHPQYMLRTDLVGAFLPLTGGTMTGPIQLPAGFPVSATEAASKAYVDTFAGSVITKNIISDATGDGQGTVEGGWNAQANLVGITRASNEIIYYRWPSGGTVVYRYTGSHQGPAGWATTASDWVAASGVAEAPLDGNIYGRIGAAWAQVVARAGGSYTGKVQGFAGAAAAADLARTDEVQAISAAGIAGHVALLDPHSQYVLKSGFTAPGLFPDGTLAAPGISWANEPTAGLYRAAFNTFHYAIGGASVFTLTPGGVGITGRVAINISDPAFTIDSSPVNGATVGMRIIATTAQTANLQVWSEVSGGMVSGIGPDGVPIGRIAPLDALGKLPLANMQAGRVRAVSFTRDVSIVSGQSITGVGFPPKVIILIAAIHSTKAFSIGVVDSVSGANVGYVDDTADVPGNWVTAAGQPILLVASPNNNGNGSVSSFDADGFSINWTKTNSPTGTAFITALCFG